MRELMPMDENNMIIGCWSIEKDGAEYPTREELYKAYHAGISAKTEPYVDDLKGASLLSETPEGGEIISSEYHKDFDYTKLVLSNGATVLMKKTEIEKSQVLFKAFGDGGWTLYDEDDDPLYEVDCPECGRSFSIDEDTLLNGNNLKCPFCGHEIKFELFDEDDYSDED